MRETDRQKEEEQNEEERVLLLGKRPGKKIQGKKIGNLEGKKSDSSGRESKERGKMDGVMNSSHLHKFPSKRLRLYLSMLNSTPITWMIYVG